MLKHRLYQTNVNLIIWSDQPFYLLLFRSFSIGMMINNIEIFLFHPPHIPNKLIIQSRTLPMLVQAHQKVELMSCICVIMLK